MQDILRLVSQSDIVRDYKSNFYYGYQVSLRLEDLELLLQLGDFLLQLRDLGFSLNNKFWREIKNLATQKICRVA